MWSKDICFCGGIEPTAVIKLLCRLYAVTEYDGYAGHVLSSCCYVWQIYPSCDVCLELQQVLPDRSMMHPEWSFAVHIKCSGCIVCSLMPRMDIYTFILGCCQSINVESESCLLGCASLNVWQTIPPRAGPPHWCISLPTFTGAKTPSTLQVYQNRSVSWPKTNIQIQACAVYISFGCGVR